MKCDSKPFTQIDRDYKITSKELRQALKLEGEITSIYLFTGRSPNEIEKGKSAEEDVWTIVTQEVKDGKAVSASSKLWKEK